MSTKILLEVLRRGLLAMGEAIMTRQALFWRPQTAAPGDGVGRSAVGKVSRSGLAVLCALGVVVGHAAISRADNVCNGQIDFQYPVPPNPPGGAHNVGDKVTVLLDLGAGTITGGPMNILTITSVRFDMACSVPPLPAPMCANEGPVISYDGDSSITSNCPGGAAEWTSTNPGGGETKALIFTAVPPVIVPHDTADPPGTCFLQFTETVLAPSHNPAGFIEQVVGYNQAQCDNGELDSGGFQTGEVKVVVPTVDFDCYEADSSFSSSGHTLTDVFGTFTNVTVGSAQRLCAPARKLTDPDQTLGTEHLVGYVITTPLKRKVKGVVVNSPQFGSFTVDVTKVAGKAALLVPSFKTVGKGALPPPQDTNPSDHFLCYNFDTVSGGIPGPVQVRDQFNPNPPGTKPPQTVTFTNQKSWRLCVPVDKDGLDPSAPTNTSGLLCLVTGNDINSPLKNTFVNWANQFQNPATNVHADKLDDFCVTAIVTP
jgi:hypothetical protein